MSEGAELATGLRIVFVAGAGRSGSTLLDRLLGSVPGVVSVGELRHIWSLGFLEGEFCGCGEPFIACPFWSAVIDEAYGGAEGVDGVRFHDEQERLLRLRNTPGLTWDRVAGGRLREARATWADRQGRLLRAIASAGGGTTIVDSSKNPSYGLLLATLPGIDLRVLHLVRDSRAVAYSWTKRVLPHPLQGGRPTFDLAKTWQAATWWWASNVLAEALPPLRRRYLRIRYEDLARDPGPVLDRITHFAGLPPIRPIAGTRATFDLGVHHTAGGNPMRWERGAVEVRPDAAWRTAYRSRSRHMITASTLPLLWRYRYALPWQQ